LCVSFCATVCRQPVSKYFENN